MSDLKQVTIRSQIEMALRVIRMYDWLLDLYVLDFFVNNHWEKLPKSWQQSFKNMDPQNLAEILSNKPSRHLLPLSFLALMKSVQALSIPRQNSVIPMEKTEIENLNILKNHPKLKNLFLKHVKLKKRHEINLMADVVLDTAEKTDCKAVIDFGSGLGHLVRVLAYRENIYAAGIECQTQLTQEARNLDLELEYTVKKHISVATTSKLRQPLHFNVNLSSYHQLQELPLPETMTNYGLIGLHPCGDLGPLLLKHFVESNHVMFICVVGCCHMKLTCGQVDGGYPMSTFSKGLDSKLSYPSREISCHAIEVYCERLSKGNYKDLKIHAFRAALERILVEHDPKLRHAPVRSIKHSDSMTFEKYCALALERINLPLPTCPNVWARGYNDLEKWKRVVVVYTFRLMLAPLVETVILLDRMLYVIENGLLEAVMCVRARAEKGVSHGEVVLAMSLVIANVFNTLPCLQYLEGFSCEIRPVFDPKLSPRNHIIIAKR